jgi:SAM-dependent methyltransferase
MSQGDVPLGLTADKRYYCLPPLEGKRVLEIGCNVGFLAHHIVRNLKASKYRGIDTWMPPSPTPELRTRWFCGDIQRKDTLPFDERWDVVICFDVLYHLISPLEALRNLFLLTEECLVLGTAIVAVEEPIGPDGKAWRPAVQGPYLRFEPSFRGDDSNFFFPTEQCLTRMLNWAGFTRLERKYCFKESAQEGFIDRVVYHCY